MHFQMHCPLMTLQRMLSPKFAATDVAAEFLRSVSFLVFIEIRRISTGEAADVTLIWFLASMGAAVDCYPRLSECDGSDKTVWGLT